MMVRVDLSSFFVDHRSVARIFLNNSLRLIRDVEQHIADTFNIQVDFLSCDDNEYLPPSEDARIIKEGDVVTVARKLNYGSAVNTKIATINGNKTEDIVLGKQRVRVTGAKSILKDDKNDCPKSKRQKIETIELISNETTDEEIDRLPPLKTKKMRQVKEKTDSEDEEEKDPEEEKSSDSEEERSDSEEESSDSESEQQRFTNSTMKKDKANKQSRSCVAPARKEHSMKPSQVSFRKHIKVPNEEPKKRINIIETIILRGGKIVQNQESKPVQVATEKTLKPVEEIKENTLNISDNGIGKIEECGESMDQSLLSDSTVGGTTKRKRIRKRKRATLKPNNNTNSGLAPGNFIARDDIKKRESTPRLHLKFDDVTVENDTKNSTETNWSSRQNGNSKDSQIVVLSPEENLAQVEATEDVVTEEANCVSTLKNLSHRTNYVSPNTNRKPIAGDMLSFKMLRLSQDYTPELSCSITATVLHFENGVITLNIEDGLNQCREPLGKFSIACPDEVPPETSTTTRVFNWSELIEPQIL